MKLGNPTKLCFCVDGRTVATRLIDSGSPWPNVGDSFDAGGRVLRIVDRRIVSRLDTVVFRCVDESVANGNEWPSGKPTT